MKSPIKSGLPVALLALYLAACSDQTDSQADATAAEPPKSPTSEATTKANSSASSFSVPIEYHTLDNGLKVIISEDHTTPTAVVAVYYNIGFRIEPRNRTGFAHLFEHMMFQGSKNLGKMEFVRLVQANGGVLNGSTRFDYTNYFEIVPTHKLETMLWAEADRMKGLAITQDNLVNQQGVVKNEVKVNVLNQPYGGFPWLYMPQYANENWFNAHNFYGDLEDLDAATLDDVNDFFFKYYAPNNAAVALVGDFDADEALAMVEKYFGDISPSPDPIELPDISEPRQEEEKKVTKTDPLAERPGFAFAYHVPERLTPEWYAMGLLDQILIQGDDSLLHQAFVKEEGITSSVSGGINALLGNMLNYKGPMLWTGSFIHDEGHDREELLAILDRVVDDVIENGIDQETLDRAKVKWRSFYYDYLGGTFGFGRADLMASLALFDDDPMQINDFEKNIMAVTADQVRDVAREYLRPTNRTSLVWAVGEKEGGPDA